MQLTFRPGLQAFLRTKLIKRLKPPFENVEEKANHQMDFFERISSC